MLWWLRPHILFIALSGSLGAILSIWTTYLATVAVRSKQNAESSAYGGGGTNAATPLFATPANLTQRILQLGCPPPSIAVLASSSTSPSSLRFSGADSPRPAAGDSTSFDMSSSTLAVEPKSAINGTGGSRIARFLRYARSLLCVCVRALDRSPLVHVVLSAWFAFVAAASLAAAASLDDGTGRAFFAFVALVSVACRRHLCS